MISLFLSSLVEIQTPTAGVIIAAVLAAILLFISGYASGSEIAFFSLTPSDLNELDPEKSTIDRNIQMLREDSERTLATILISNNFVNVTIIMLCNYVFASVFQFLQNRPIQGTKDQENRKEHKDLGHRLQRTQSRKSDR